jgi:hypothetical protein
MKHLGKKSLSAVLAFAANLLLWVEIGAACIGVCMVFLAAYFRRAFALQIPISYLPMTSAQIQSAGQNKNFGVINTTNGILSINVDASWQNIMLILLGYGALLAVVVLITYQIKRIFENFRQDQPFHQSNIGRIANIALILIGYSLVQWTFVIVVNQILLSRFTIWHNLELTYDFNFSCLIVGVVLLAVQGVFKAGLVLEEDKQLTI